MALKIPEDWPRCVVPLETIQDSHFIGTGFLMNYYTMPLLVTNKHVIKGRKIQYRLNLPGNRIDRIKIRHEEGYEEYFEWVGHPDEKIDLAAILVPYEISAKVIGMYFDQIGGSEELYDSREIFYWGFPLGAGAEDRHQHYPILRTGVVAQNRLENRFMIEANIFPGSSGSPIFTKPKILKDENKMIFKAPRLIGVVSSYIPYRERAFSEQTGLPRIIFQENSGLAWAIKIQCVYDIINSKEFKDQVKPIFEEFKLEKIPDMRSHAHDFDPHRKTIHIE